MKSPFRFALALVALAVVAPAPAQSPTSQMLQLLVQQIKGPVLINRVGTQEFQPLQVNDVIARQDRVLLQSNARLRLQARLLDTRQRQIQRILDLDRPGIYTGNQLFDQAWQGQLSQGSQQLGRTLGTIGGGAVAGGLASGAIETSNSSKPPVQPISH